MFRKIVFGALTLVFALYMVGCGGGDNASAPQKPKPEATADKAVLAYAQLYAYGTPEDDAQKAAGMTEADIEKVQQQVVGPLIEAFGEFPLSKENVENITAEYITKLHAAMNIKTKIKKDDAEHPIVELTVMTVDSKGVEEVAKEDEGLLALGMAFAELQEQGYTIEQLKENEEFQQTALEAINKFIDEFPFNEEISMDVPCVVVEGSDGKAYWKPEKPEDIAKFVTGQ